MLEATAPRRANAPPPERRAHARGRGCGRGAQGTCSAEIESDAATSCSTSRTSRFCGIALLNSSSSRVPMAVINVDLPQPFGPADAPRSMNRYLLPAARCATQRLLGEQRTDQTIPAAVDQGELAVTKQGLAATTNVELIHDDIVGAFHLCY